MIRLLFGLFLFCSAVYADSFSRAAERNCPLVIAILGPEGCPWSAILEEKIINDPRFLTAMEDVELHQMRLCKDALAEELSQGQFPVFVLLDPKGKVFGHLGFLPIDGKEYSEKLHGLIDDFGLICSTLPQDPIDFDEDYLKVLYEKAKMLSVDCYSQVMIETGIKNEKGNYFHLEKYAILLEKLPVDHFAVVDLKKKMLKRGVDRDQVFKMACLEFHKLSTLCVRTRDYRTAMQPLLNYVQKYAKSAAHNCYQAELMIAEFLREKRIIAEALKHARAAEKLEPNGIAKKLIQWIEEQR